MYVKGDNNYKPIVKINIDALIARKLDTNSVMANLKLLSNKCRLIFTYSFNIPKSDIIKLFSKYNILQNTYKIRENYTERQNALGNLLAENTLSFDYEFTLTNNVNSHIDNIFEVKNFYLKLYEFEDGAHIGFKHGNFDNWCVDFHYPDGKIENPLDTYYFGILKTIAAKYENGEKLIYDMFMDVYSWTTSAYDYRVIDNIVQFSKEFDIEDETDFRNCMSMIYLGMIAEQNKKNAILKKAIKALGMYQIFIQNLDIKYAANFSKDKRVSELRPIMENCGIKIPN